MTALSTRKRPVSEVEQDEPIARKVPAKRPRRAYPILPEREIDVAGQVKALREKRKKDEDSLLPFLPRGVVDATEVDGAFLSDDENYTNSRDSIVNVQIVPMIHRNPAPLVEERNPCARQNYKVFRKVKRYFFFKYAHLCATFMSLAFCSSCLI